MGLRRRALLRGIGLVLGLLALVVVAVVAVLAIEAHATRHRAHRVAVAAAVAVLPHRGEVLARLEQERGQIEGLGPPQGTWTYLSCELLSHDAGFIAQSYYESCRMVALDVYDAGAASAAQVGAAVGGHSADPFVSEGVPACVAYVALPVPPDPAVRTLQAQWHDRRADCDRPGPPPEAHEVRVVAPSTVPDGHRFLSVETSESRDSGVLGCVWIGILGCNDPLSRPVYP